MKDNFPDIYWATSTRADFISEELIHELETGNCYQVGWGFESGSQKVLNLMKKRVRRGTNINAYRIVDQSNLIPSCSLMVGNVGEDNDTVKETVDAIRIAKFTTDGVFYAAPYPGSRIWDWAVERGIIKNTHEYLMSISDVGAVVLQTNMTPFPDWVLKAWNKLLGYECKFNENAMWRKNLFNRPWHGVINDWIALYFGIRFKCLSTCRLIVYPVPSGLPIFAISPLLEIFFIYDKIRRRFHITERDKKYEYSVDKEGALLPENHNTGLPQRAMKNERVEKFLEVCPRDVIDI